ncbi:MAG TPA: aminotransferase class III-fold pyridoxal phosphate-dependent enzyme, partial [Chromatiaceae bacterium]|nr:aminotransferase class III-fold pyridoxal phosphate-dependent enzyme [Chromatiaceae bacterium]
HGRTLATLSATGNRKVQAGFEPLVHGLARVPYGDLDALESAAHNLKSVAAVLVEPIQGEGGVNVPPDDYLTGIRSLCDKQGWLMMLDEIQTGMGRTGKPFAYQHFDLKPDIMTLAKALGNGVPVGACLARGEAADLFAPGSHGSTFGGNPLACAAGMAVLDAMEGENLSEHAAGLGEQLLKGFRQRLGELEGVTDIRGRGLMIGIELNRPCAELVNQALDAGLLINVTAERVVRLLPPLVMTESEAEQLLDGVSSLIEQFLASE